MAAKIRRNDEVIVLAGKDKGKKGKVTKVLATGKVIVEGINLVKKHQKPVPAMNIQGGIVEQEAAIDVSNVAILTQLLVKLTVSVSVLKTARKFVSSSLTAKPFLTNRVIWSSTMAKLHDYYKSSVVAELTKQFGYTSVMQVPRIEKITLNMGVGEAINDKKLLENAAADMATISGQKPLITKARKSVAGFKIREGYPIGCKVTLRGERMWDFLERLIRSLFHVYVTSVALALSLLTDAVTTAWAFASKSSSRKSTLIKLIEYAV